MELGGKLRGRKSTRRSVLVAFAVAIVTLVASSLASGAVGGLTYRGCITGESESGPPGGGGTGACKAIPDASSDGESSGLGGLRSVALSRDGKSLYAASGGDDAVARFKRDRDRGKLTYKGCISGDGESACKAIPDASSGGENSGLDELQSVALSRNGRSLYAASAGDDAVARFKRDRDRGKLTYKGCISGDGESACKAIPDASSGGQSSGLDDLRSVALSRDGKSLYAGSAGDDSVARFKRDRDTGKLTYKGCISGDGESACKAIPDASSGGENSGLDELQSVALSRNGRSLYAASAGDDAVARFKRDRDTGKLTYKGCISGDGESACKAIPDASSGGENSGLDELQSVALSRNGRSLYAASAGDDAVARFKRDRDTGKLTYRGCITGESQSGGGTGACKAIPDPSSGGESSGLDELQSVALSRDGKSLYTASLGDAAVARFKRDRDTGKLTYRGCITGESESGPPGGGGTGACKAIPDASSGGESSGLGGLGSVALSGDGKSLYTASGGDSGAGDAAVARFKRDRDTGKLTYRGCITGESESGPPGGGGTGACKAIPGATSFGDNSGLDDLEAVALSGDGKSLYAAAGDDAAVARFRRDRDTGKLTYKRCISGDDESACKEIPDATPGGYGEQSGLDNPQSLTLSGDGKSLYVASLGDSAVGRFRRER